MSTVAQRFESMFSKITPTQSDIDTAIKTHTYMREQLQKKEWIIKTFLTGSYIRGTAINPLNDVDFFCEVDPRWARDKTPAQIQREVQQVLQAIYGGVHVHRQKHSLGVDLPQSIGYDVIPAVPNGDHYKIVHRESGDGIFILSNPDVVERTKNDAIARGGPGGRMSQMIRLMKHWNTKNHKKVKSFHLELLCYKACSTLASCQNNRDACWKLFEFLSATVQGDCFVPGVPKTGVSAAQQNNLRYSKTPAQLANFAGELGAAARKAKRAVENERANPAEAHGIWQELFGVDY